MKRADTRTRLEDVPTVRRMSVAKLADRSGGTEQADDEFALFFSRSLDLHCIAGLDGYFRRLNHAWTARLGWTREELKARPFLDFVHVDDRAATLAELDRLVRGVKTILFENRYRRRDNSYLWLQWNAQPMRGRQEIFATARDVTGRKRLEKEVLEIVDRERRRLGRELHDGLCQTLAGIAALSSVLADGLAAGSATSASTAAEEITVLLRGSISQARDLARGLDPIGLRDTSDSLDEALEILAVDIKHRFRIECTFKRDRPTSTLRQDVKMHLFRIAQEALNNAVSHGRAKRVEIILSRKGAKGLLRILDDGVGVHRGTRNRSGIGLHTMAYRAGLIGGSLEVRPRTGNGTAVTCAFPVRKTSRIREGPLHVPEST